MAYGYIIYGTKTEINGCYFGITNYAIEKRFRRHISNALANSTIYLHRAMRKYGCDNFQIHKLFEDCDFEKCKEWEINIISEAKHRGIKLWNLTDGGDGSTGFNPTEESKRKKSEKMKGIPRGPFSEEHCRKISEAKTGKPPWNKGLSQSAGTIKKRGYKHSPETRQKFKEAWVRRKAAKLSEQMESH